MGVLLLPWEGRASTPAPVRSSRKAASGVLPRRRMSAILDRVAVTAARVFALHPTGARATDLPLASGDPLSRFPKEGKMEDDLRPVAPVRAPAGARRIPSTGRGKQPPKGSASVSQAAATGRCARVAAAWQLNELGYLPKLPTRDARYARAAHQLGPTPSATWRCGSISI